MQLVHSLHKCPVCGWLWLAFPAPPSLALNCSPAWDWASHPHGDTVSLQNSHCVKFYISNYHKYVFTYHLCRIPNWDTIFPVMLNVMWKADCNISPCHTWVCACLFICLFLYMWGEFEPSLNSYWVVTVEEQIVKLACFSGAVRD